MLLLQTIVYTAIFAWCFLEHSNHKRKNRFGYTAVGMIAYACLLKAYQIEGYLNGF